MLKSLDDRLARSAATVSQRLTMLVERLIVDAIQRQDEALTKVSMSACQHVSMSACQHVILVTDSTKREPDRQTDRRTDRRTGRHRNVFEQRPLLQTCVSCAMWCACALSVVK